MNKNFMALLHKIRSAHEDSVWEDARQLRGLLADYAMNDYEGERHLFILALEKGVASRLREEQNLSVDFLRAQALYFAETYSLTKKGARFVVWCWAEVLGLCSNGKPVLLQNMSARGRRVGNAASPSKPTGSAAPSSYSGESPSSVDISPTDTGKDSRFFAGIFFLMLLVGMFLLFYPTANNDFSSVPASGKSAPKGNSSGGGSPPPAPASTGREQVYKNSIGMEFVRIPSGFFEMGSPDEDQTAYPDERPRHKVTITKPFYLGKYEVTQGQWKAVMGNNPSHFEGDSRPVENVSWNDAQEFIRKLNQKEKTNRYRLPTEAEWEYAARAGSTTLYNFGNDPGLLSQYAWHLENSGNGTRPVGGKPANAWGLHDMYGNVWEWVQDWYGGRYYASSPEMNPEGPSGGEKRALRGGCWISRSVRSCRSATRGGWLPHSRESYGGFRLVFSPE